MQDFRGTYTRAHRSPGYRGHPQVVTGPPGTRKGSIHPQKSAFHTLELQGAPPTPAEGARRWDSRNLAFIFS